MNQAFESLANATGWDVSPDGEIQVEVDETPAERRDLTARATVYSVRRPEGHALDLLYVAAENNERWVEARHITSPSVRLRRLEGRLRLTVLPHGGHAFCELRQARAKGESWANLYKASLAELDSSAGVSVAKMLRVAGAHAVGSREALLGDSDRRRAFLCTTFDNLVQQVPVMAFLLTRTVPLAREDDLEA